MNADPAFQAHCPDANGVEFNPAATDAVMRIAAGADACRMGVTR